MAKGDLISRATLLKALRKEQRECEKDGEEYGGESILFAEAFGDVIDMVKRLPAVDEVPVVHARWNRKGENAVFDVEWECGKCGCGISTSGIFTPQASGWNFCPSCGAKMDGGADDGT